MGSTERPVQRQLIVNADDFGRSAGVNRGILRAHRDGVLTSASLMVRWPAAAEAAHDAGAISLGLHVDLGEWTFRGGRWECMYQRVQLDDVEAIQREVSQQLAEFERLVRRPPTHLDSHQHVHLREPVRSVLRKTASELAIPLRSCTHGIRYCGDFYGQSSTGKGYPEAITVTALAELLRQLPTGITELGCHPGSDPQLESMYCREREQEVQVLCDPRIREVILEEGIRLLSLADVAREKSVAD